MKKRIFNLVIIIVGIGLIISLSRNILRLFKAGGRVKETQDHLEMLEKENQQLQAQRDYYQSDEFVEEQARNKLNLAKEGETIIILPENLEELVGQEEFQNPDRIPNWQQWYQLFF